jgi:hypothetical protein
MSFLERFPPVRGLPPTHTLMSGGCMYVTDDDRDDFEARYVALLLRARAEGSFPCFTERPSPCWFPVIADVDVEVRAGTAPPASASADAVGSAAALAFARAIRDVSGLASLECHLMRRSGPRDGKFGAHAIFPGALFCRSGQRLVAELAKAELEAGAFEAAGVTALVVDECYARNTNWQMYGSTKPSLSGDPYLATATHAFAFAAAEDVDGAVSEAVSVTPIAPEDARDWPRWVALTRVRSLENAGPSPLLPAFEERANRMEFEAAKEVAKRAKGAAERAESRAARSNGVCDEDPAFVSQLLDCLSVERSLHYDTWFQIGTVLASLGDVRELWHEFSRRAAEKYDARTCDRKWESLRRRTGSAGGGHGGRLSIGTLIMYARLDSPDRLRGIMAARSATSRLARSAAEIYDLERNRPCLVSDAATGRPSFEIVQSGTAPCRMYFCATLRVNICTIDDLVGAVAGCRAHDDVRSARAGFGGGVVAAFLRTIGFDRAIAWHAIGSVADGVKRVRVTYDAAVDSFITHRALASRLRDYVLRHWDEYPLLQVVDRCGRRDTIFEQGVYDTLAQIPLAVGHADYFEMAGYRAGDDRGELREQLAGV